MRVAVISPLFLFAVLSASVGFGQSGSVTVFAPEPSPVVVTIPSPPAIPAPPEVVGVAPVVEPPRVLTADSVPLAPLPMPPSSYLRIFPQWDKPITAEMKAKAVELEVRFFEWHRPANQPVPVDESKILPAGYVSPDYDSGLSQFDDKCILSTTEQTVLLERLQRDLRSEFLASTRMKFIAGRPGQVRRGIEKSTSQPMGTAWTSSIPMELIPHEAGKSYTHFLGTALELTVIDGKPGTVSMQINLSRTRMVSGANGVGLLSGGDQMKVALRSDESFFYRGFREARTVTKSQEQQNYSVSIPGLGTLPPVEVASTRRSQEIVEFVLLITPLGVSRAK